MKRRLKVIWRKIKRITRLAGSPHAIAMGAAVGIFINFIPTFGIGFLIAAGTARILKGSAVAALTMNLGTGMFIPLFYSLNFFTGRFLLNRHVDMVELEDTLQQSLQESLEVADEPAKYFLLDKLQAFSTDFFLGGLINALLAGCLVYLVFWGLLSFRKYRQKTRQQQSAPQDKAEYPPVAREDH